MREMALARNIYDWYERKKFHCDILTREKLSQRLFHCCTKNHWNFVKGYIFQCLFEQSLIAWLKNFVYILSFLKNISFIYCSQNI